MGFAQENTKKRQNLKLLGSLFGSSIVLDKIFEMHFHLLKIFGCELKADPLASQFKDTIRDEGSTAL